MLNVGDDIRLLEDIEDREGIRIYALSGSIGAVRRVEKGTYLVDLASGRYGKVTLRVNQKHVEKVNFHGGR